MADRHSSEPWKQHFREHRGERRTDRLVILRRVRNLVKQKVELPLAFAMVFCLLMHLLAETKAEFSGLSRYWPFREPSAPLPDRVESSEPDWQRSCGLRQPHVAGANVPFENLIANLWGVGWTREDRANEKGQ